MTTFPAGGMVVKYGRGIEQGKREPIPKIIGIGP
jgi:hypothetical protein